MYLIGHKRQLLGVLSKVVVSAIGINRVGKWIRVVRLWDIVGRLIVYFLGWVVVAYRHYAVVSIVLQVI